MQQQQKIKDDDDRLLVVEWLSLLTGYDRSYYETKTDADLEKEYQNILKSNYLQRGHDRR